MIQIDTTDGLYLTLKRIGVDEDKLDDEYIKYATMGVSNAKELNKCLQSILGLDYIGEIDENTFEEVVDYYTDLKLSKPPHKNKVIAMFKEYQVAPSDKLKQDIIHSQLKEVLLIACAYKLRHTDLILGDLVQVCNLGLLTAVDKFDVNMKTPFEVNLNYWILDAIDKEFTLRRKDG